MLINKIKNFAAEDSAENSIMQTISIAVSAILIAAGLITAPSLINNARDTNAKTDLANLAYAQEYALSNTGGYAGTLSDLKSATTATADSDLQGGVKATYSTNSIKIDNANVGGEPHYTANVLSKSGKVFARDSENTSVGQVGTAATDGSDWAAWTVKDNS